LGLKNVSENAGEQLHGAIQLLIDMRKEAKAKKDYAASDKIRNNLAALGILLKDEKDGSVSYSFE
jgi:cysteinyl-tRNA synthetase